MCKVRRRLRPFGPNCSPVRVGQWAMQNVHDPLGLRFATLSRPACRRSQSTWQAPTQLWCVVAPTQHEPRCRPRRQWGQTWGHTAAVGKIGCQQPAMIGERSVKLFLGLLARLSSGPGAGSCIKLPSLTYVARFRYGNWKRQHPKGVGDEKRDQVSVHTGLPLRKTVAGLGSSGCSTPDSRRAELRWAYGSGQTGGLRRDPVRRTARRVNRALMG